MARTTQTLVGKITEIDAGDDLTEQIDIANDMVTRVCAGVLDVNDDPYYSAAELERIERYLAAHFYRILRPKAKVEQIGPIMEGIVSQAGLVLNLTHEGQQVLLLDTAGGFAKLQAKAVAASSGKMIPSHKVDVIWMGTDYDETEYGAY